MVEKQVADSKKIENEHIPGSAVWNVIKFVFIDVEIRVYFRRLPLEISLIINFS